MGGPAARRLLLLGAVAVLLFSLPRLIDFYADWLWFGETGYRHVLVRTIATQALLAGVVAVAAFPLLFGNFRVALGAFARPFLIPTGPPGAPSRPIVLDRKALGLFAAGIAAVGSLLAGLVASRQWLTWLRYRNAVPFGESDPILGRDVSFYVFQLPFLDFLRGLLLVLVLLSFGGALVVYLMAGSVRLEPRGGPRILSSALRHLSVLAAAVMVLLAFGAWLDVPRLLVSPAGIIQGAGYVDVAVRLPVLRGLMIVSLVGAALALSAAFRPRLWPIVAAGAGYLAVWGGGAVWASTMQRFIVAPNEQVRETPYITHNIDATRRAFALDAIEERELSGDAALSREDIAANEETIRNVRLWDHQPLLDTFAQIQEIRTYYDFVSVDNDRYVIDGQYRQIMLSARELNSESLPNRSWINERLVFTHGYGLALGPVNQVTQEGLPVLFIKNLPPESSVDLAIEEPSIYFGELSNDHVFVRTKAEEFHYPKGDDNVYTTYAGEGGVPVGGLMRKLLFSLRFRSFKVLLSDDITAGSRVLFHRRLDDRVRTIAPFLLYDGDPYLVLSDGRLFWMQDAYTTTDLYPYSSPVARGVNYIRNSVKIVVDAFHGTTRFYLADPDDPLAVVLGRVFPGLLRPLEEMPEGLRRHIRYPEGIFRLQTAVFSTYHMTNPAVFYNKEDQWEVPAIESEGRAAPMQPYYTIMKLPGEQKAEFIQILPFTPRRKDNLAAWMVARSDGEHYGRLFVFQFPKQKVVFGPRQIVARINQDQAISPQITLWNQQGSEVIQGNLLVIPIEESLLYVRPLYLRAAGGRIPELKRVIVAYQNQIVMEETLEEGLERIFGGAAPRSAAARSDALERASAAAREAPAGSPEQEAAARALRHYRRALQAQREGDWARYGEEIRLLGEALEEISRNP